MESSENQETAPDATNPVEKPDDAPLEQAPADSQSAPDDSPTPAEEAEDASGIETAQTSGAGTPEPWYPVAGATDPVMSAVEPVPDATTPVSAAESPEAASVPATSAAPLDSAATEGPVWPADTATPEATNTEAPAAEVSLAAAEIDAAEAATAHAEETSAAAEGEAPAAVDDVVPAVSATEDEVEVPGIVEAGAAGVIAAEAAALTEADDPAASSGAWPEPPTPWADTGAIAAIGAAVGATSGATETPQVATPQVATPDEVSASDAAAMPDVSDLPTAVNTPQSETPQVGDAPSSPPEEPPPPQPSAGYAAPLQPVAGAYVAPQARPVNTTPVIVEAILAFFGIYGVGWLIAGETTIGIVLLIAGFVWDAIFVVAAFTVIGLCCVVPLQLIFVALSAFQLNNRLRMRA